MGWSFGIGTIAGIRVRLHVTFVLFVGWIAVTRGLFTEDPGGAIGAVVLLLLIFACVLLHELGHALAARRYGVLTRDIILLPIGGVARLQRMPDKPSQEIVVALAGPAVNVVLAAALLLFARGAPDAILEMAAHGAMLQTLIVVNVMMVVFNMIPAFPMDGGRVLRAALALRLPYARATQIASIVGQSIALLFATVGLFAANLALVLIALFVFLAAGEERSSVQARTTLSGVPVSAAMLSEFRTLDVRDPLQRAVDYLMAGSQQDFPVMDGPHPVGMLNRNDLVAALQTHGAGAPLGDVVRRDPEHADPAEPLEAALQRMREKACTALPVLHHGDLVGLITLENVGDLLLVRSALRRYVGGGSG
jgi:Zn-dependent protease/predicted transcriptional regulator